MQQTIADTRPKMYSLHNSESALVKMHIRTRPCSAQSALMSHHLPQSSRVSSPVSCHCPLTHAPPSLNMPGKIPLWVLAPAGPYSWNTFSTVLSKAHLTAFTSLLTFPDHPSRDCLQLLSSLLPSLMSSPPEPSSTGNIRFFSISLSDFPYQPCKVHMGHKGQNLCLCLLCPYPHHLEKLPAYSNPD